MSILRGKRRKKDGLVISDKMDKSVVVKVERTWQHPVYKKVMRTSDKFKAHNEDNKAKLGDRVKIVECRSVSKDKHWRVAEVL